MKPRAQGGSPTILGWEYRRSEWPKLIDSKRSENSVAPAPCCSIFLPSNGRELGTIARQGKRHMIRIICYPPQFWHLEQRLF